MIKREKNEERKLKNERKREREKEERKRERGEKERRREREKERKRVLEIKNSITNVVPRQVTYFTTVFPIYKIRYCQNLIKYLFSYE